MNFQNKDDERNKRNDEDRDENINLFHCLELCCLLVNETHDSRRNIFTTQWCRNLLGKTIYSMQVQYGGISQDSFNRSRRIVAEVINSFLGQYAGSVCRLMFEIVF